MSNPERKRATLEKEPHNQHREDVLFIRNFLEQMGQLNVYRWRKNGDAAFKSPIVDQATVTQILLEEQFKTAATEQPT